MIATPLESVDAVFSVLHSFALFSDKEVIEIGGERLNS
jgi:hypothetical protein